KIIGTVTPWITVPNGIYKRGVGDATRPPREQGKTPETERPDRGRGDETGAEFSTSPVKVFPRRSKRGARLHTAIRRAAALACLLVHRHQLLRLLVQRLRPVAGGRVGGKKRRRLAAALRAHFLPQRHR